MQLLSTLHFDDCEILFIFNKISQQNRVKQPDKNREL